MPTRCPSCGTHNLRGAIKCSGCQFSFEHISQEEMKSLKNLHVFAIIFLITAVISALDFTINVLATTLYGASFNYGLTAVFSGLTTSFSSSNLTIFVLLFEAILVAILFVQCLSFIYLRSSFIKLREFDFNFSTPTTGTTLLIVGVILAIIGFGVLLAFLIPLLGSLGPTPSSQATLPLAALGAVALGGFVGIIGGLLLVIGYIIGLLLGLHRLARKFEESYFDFALVMIIVALLFTPLELIAAILIIMGTRKSRQRIEDGSLDALMASP